MKTAEVFGGKKVALFAVPGAYTPTCHKQHMAGFVQNYDELKKKGFDMVACTSANDMFVLTNWAKDSKADGKILMLADGSAEFAKKIGLDIDLTCPRHGRALQALLDDRGGRRRQGAQRRGRASRPRQIERRQPVRHGVSLRSAGPEGASSGLEAEFEPHLRSLIPPSPDRPTAPYKGPRQERPVGVDAGRETNLHAAMAQRTR